jgi:peptide/nickel transport system permease protein
MMKLAWKKIAFLSSLFFLIGLVCFSFYYTYVLKNQIQEPPTFLYDEKGNITKTFPFPPSWQFPFGINRLGHNLFWLVVGGAKYTILIGLSVSLLRVALGVGIGIIYGMYLQKIRIVFTTIERAFRFVPAIFLAMMFINFNFFGQSLKGSSYIISVVIVLTVLALPSLVSVIGKEVVHFNKESYITSSKAMGATNFWIIRKHVLPFLRSRMLLMIIQQMISVLLLLVHLGVFRIFVGGTIVIHVTEERILKFPASSEWSALIGVSYQELMLDPWVVFGPSVAFILTLLACYIMKRVIEGSDEFKIPKLESKKEINSLKIIEKSDFIFAEQHLNNREIVK